MDLDIQKEKYDTACPKYDTVGFSVFFDYLFLESFREYICIK